MKPSLSLLLGKSFSERWEFWMSWLGFIPTPREDTLHVTRTWKFVKNICTLFRIFLCGMFLVEGWNSCSELEVLSASGDDTLHVTRRWNPSTEKLGNGRRQEGAEWLRCPFRVLAILLVAAPALLFSHTMQSSLASTWTWPYNTSTASLTTAACRLCPHYSHLNPLFLYPRLRRLHPPPHICYYIGISQHANLPSSS